MKLDVLELTVPPHRTQEVIKQFYQETIGVVLSEEQYEEKTFLALAAIEDMRLLRVFRLWSRDPAISLERKGHCEIYRLQTLISPIQDLLKTFPLGEEEEWFLADTHTAYLCLLSPHPSAQQIAWLARCSSIHGWGFPFPLSSSQEAPLP